MSLLKHMMNVKFEKIKNIESQPLRIESDTETA